jgi:hypothetical protein
MDQAGTASTGGSPPKPDAPKESIMNSKHFSRFATPVIAALALATAFSAQAESPMPEDQNAQVWTSTKTRAQVQAELVQARADGSMRVYSIGYNPLAVAKSTASRDEVKAEVAVARAQGTLDVMTGEDSGSFYLASLNQRREAGRILAAR